MTKVSIIMYSTFSGDSYKAPQLKKLTEALMKQDMLCNGYGLADKNDITLENPLRDKLKLSKINRYSIGALGRLIKCLHINDFYKYYFGELLMNRFAKKVMKDDSNIVFVKHRPYKLVKLLKESGKFIIVEASEMHPRFSQSECISERKKYNFKLSTIFENERITADAEKTFKVADLIIALSEDCKKNYIKYGISSEKIKVINLGTACERYITKTTEGLDFIYTAFHSTIKMTHRLLESWKKIEHKGSKLYIIGKLHEDIKSFVMTHGPYKNVIFMGYMDSHSIGEFYKHHKGVGIQISMAEGYSRVVAEYLSYSMPSIVSPVATCGLIVDEYNGLIINNRSEYEIINAIQKFIDTPNFYETIQKNVISTSIPTIDDYVKNCIKLFKEIGESL